MEGSVLSFLKAEWKVSDTGSAQPTEPLVFVTRFIYSNRLSNGIFQIL